MKKILFASLACAFLLSCNRDNDDDNSSSSSVVGKWKITKYLTISGKDKTTILDSETNSGCEASDSFEFKSDKTYIFNYYDDSTGSCKLTDTVNGTYSYNSSTKILSIIDNGTTENNEIFKITNSEMQFITDTDDYNNDGVLDMEIAVFAKQ